MVEYFEAGLKLIIFQHNGLIEVDKNFLVSF